MGHELEDHIWGPRAGGGLWVREGLGERERNGLCMKHKEYFKYQKRKEHLRQRRRNVIFIRIIAPSYLNGRQSSHTYFLSVSQILFLYWLYDFWHYVSGETELGLVVGVTSPKLQNLVELQQDAPLGVFGVQLGAAVTRPADLETWRMVLFSLLFPVSPKYGLDLCQMKDELVRSSRIWLCGGESHGVEGRGQGCSLHSLLPSYPGLRSGGCHEPHEAVSVLRTLCNQSSHKF